MPRTRKETVVASIPPSGWITAQALASLLGCSIDSVKRFAERNELTRVIIGGKWLLMIDDLKRIAQEKTGGK